MLPSEDYLEDAKPKYYPVLCIILGIIFATVILLIPLPLWSKILNASLIVLTTAHGLSISYLNSMGYIIQNENLEEYLELKLKE